ncbi:MAG: AMP-binding protein [Thermoanaerobaculia bacterium]
MPLDTLQHLLQRAREFPLSGLRLVDRAERESFHSWAAIAERSSFVAGGLARLGIRPGDRVGLIYPTSPEFFDAFFGTLLAGAVPVPLYPPVRLGRLAEYHQRTAAMLTAASARLLLAEGRVHALLGETLVAARLPLGGRTLGDLPRDAPLAIAGAPSDLAMVQFSSGTTVEPKPVALTQAAVLAQVRALNALWPAPAPTAQEPMVTGVSWLPLYHDMGLIGCVFPALERPSVLTLVPPEAFVARPALWLRALGRHRGTISPAPNFAYALATERIRDEEMEGIDLSSWRFALCGAETVVPEVLRAFATRFARWGFHPEALKPVYGLSEAALAVTFADLGRPYVVKAFERGALAERGEAIAVTARLPRESGEDRVSGVCGVSGVTGVTGASGAGPLVKPPIEIVSVGRPLAGFRLELRDERGAVLPENRVGRLFVAGPSLMRGYLDQPAATAATLKDGWLDTGDLGFLHDGELFLTGRAKEILLVRGRNYAPADLELAVAHLPDVREGCVAAASHLPAGRETEAVVLFVEHRKGVPLERFPALRARAREAVLARVGLAVDAVEVLAPGTLPRTSSGKIRRGEAMKRFLTGTLTAPAPVGPLRLAGALVRSRIALWKAGRAER